MSNTIHMSVQCVMPGEIAEAHRHTAAAIRFVIKGVEGAYTVVEGEPVPMGDGDLITTPSWTWHHHENGSGSDAILFSMDDWPALTALGLYREEGREQ